MVERVEIGFNAGRCSSVAGGTECREDRFEVEPQIAANAVRGDSTGAGETADRLVAHSDGIADTAGRFEWT
jgi:hypothetical protein